MEFEDEALETENGSLLQNRLYSEKVKQKLNHEDRKTKLKASHPKNISLNDKTDLIGRENKSIITNEAKGSGAITFEVYWYYLSAAGGAIYGPLLSLIMIWIATSW